MSTHRRCIAIAIAICALVGCSACSGSHTGSSAPGTVRVVAAENFYGDIALQIGGRFVSVTSILVDPNADPHLFEAGTTTGAEVADAQLVIENGLGYDAWMDRLLAASPNPDREVVNMAEVLGVSGAEANPHLWYDVPRLPQIAGAIAQALAAADPAHASEYSSQRASFVASLSRLDSAVAAIKASFPGAPVAYTEPVPGYLLAAAGLVVETPDAFARAIEEGSDPTPQAVAEMQALLTGDRVRVLLYNAQATSPITDELRRLAQAHAIPVVPVTETLPPGVNFQEWQLNQVEALAEALRA